MRAVKALMLLPVLLVPAAPQQQSISLPARAPVYCSGVIGNCVYPYVLPNTTGIIVARQSYTGAITDSLGDVWTRDQCTQFDGGDCIFSTRFNVTYPTQNVKINFPENEGYEVFLLNYNGAWIFDSGQYGTYVELNSVFSDCTNGGSCPYNWTPPVDADPGDLLISWPNENGTGSLVPNPGFGWNIEANSGHFAIEDMIAPVRGVYIGSVEWRNPDGSDNGGGHWLMGIAEYKRQH